MAKQHTVLFLLYLLCNDVAQGRGSSGIQVLSKRDILSPVQDDQGVRQDKSDKVTDHTWLGYDLDDETIGITNGGENNREKTMELELAPEELVGDCQNGVCKFCVTKHFESTDVPLFCLHAPLVGHACIHIYNIDLKERSACVGVKFKVLNKKINLKIKCFKLGHRGTDTSLFFARLLNQNLMEDDRNLY